MVRLIITRYVYVYSVYTASASQKLRHLPTVCTADMLVAEKGNKKPTGESKVINVLQSDKWQAETCIRHTLTATLTHRIPTQLNQEQSSTYLSQHSDITNLPQSRLTHHQHDWPKNNHQPTSVETDVNFRIFYVNCCGRWWGGTYLVAVLRHTWRNLAFNKYGCVGHTTIYWMPSFFQLH